MAENVTEGSYLLDDERSRLSPASTSANTREEDSSCKLDKNLDSHEKIDTEHILSAQYESLDYDVCENELHQNEEREKSKGAAWKEFNRWMVMGLVGVVTGLIASFIDYMVIKTTELKFKYVHQYIEYCVNNLCLEEPFVIWIGFNALLVFVGSSMTSYIEPVAAGSGIPQIKCFLNGVKIPHVVRLKTIICKILGVICAVAGGLVVGKEGPMIHSGAVVAAGISQGKLDSLHLDLKLFEYFRTDTEKRDFVSGGAAAGVSAAFGAPVGGVLFSLEEGASFWNQALTWRIFFASMISTFTLNIVQSYIKDRPWDLSFPGLFNFGSFNKTEYSGFEIPIFVVMGVFGGLSGALFNHINYKLSVFRIRYVNKKWMRVLEAMMVAILTGTVGYITLYFINDCQRPKTDEQYESAQIFCDDGQYSTTSGVLFQTPEESVKKMFHDAPGTYGAETLIVYCVCCFVLACWTYGLYVPSGLFIPSLLVGAIWGRLFGMLLNVMFPDQKWVSLEKYSLIGAAAQLGGIVRMTISLTVIVIEATGNITFGLPIMIVLMVAKWIGDLFNEGIYDMHIHLAGVPLLGWEPSSMLSNINAMEVMSHPVTVLRTTESIGRIVDILKQETHNGFPVVSDYDPFIEQSTEEAETFGTYQGTILRSQLIVLLKQKAFEENEDIHYIRNTLKTKDFREAYPRFPPIHQIHISPHEREFTIDLRPYINSAAYTVTDDASFPRIFRLFRGLGLRHVVVVNHRHQVVGMVTRKDLARYKISRQFGRVSMDELLISN